MLLPRDPQLCCGMLCYSKQVIQGVCKVPWKLKEDNTHATGKPRDSSFPEDPLWLSPGKGILASMDLGWSQCASVPLLSYHRHYSKAGKIWAPPVKPFDPASQGTVSDRALKYKHTKRGLQILPAVLVRIFPGQRIQIFSGAEPQAVRHSMSCLFQSMTPWNRSCKYSKRQEQVQPFMHQRQLQLQDKHPQHMAQYLSSIYNDQSIRKDTPSRLMGHKLGRGNLRAKSHLHLLGHPCHTDHCNLRCCNKQIMLTNLSCHQTWQTSRKTQQNHLSTPQLSHANHPKHIHWQLMLEGSEKSVHSQGTGAGHTAELKEL